VLRYRDDAAREPAPASIPAPSIVAAIGIQLTLLREPFRRWRFRARLAAAPRGAGEPVLVLPGMGVGDLSTLTLRRYLRRHGFDARGWGLGRHRPEVPRTLLRVLPRLEAFAGESGRAVALVGWSLGGLVARELARLRPDLVRRVITLGTPVVGGLSPTAIAGLFRLQGWDLDDVARRLAEAERTPIRVPVTAIWSRRDGIVAWRSCVDRRTPGAENLEATSCHWGLGLDPDVLVALSERLGGD
jgi:alpha-beta hydrolase superfamily lysophospholipase